MKSLALWCEMQGEKYAGEVDVHINVWKLPSSNNNDFERFIDIGILIPDASRMQKIGFYYPAKLIPDNIEDLGFRIVNNHNLVVTLFNENYSVTHIPQTNYHPITDSSNITKFRIFDARNYLTIEEHSRPNGTQVGSKIWITLNNLVPGDIYIRFRIKNNYSFLLSNIDEPKNAILQSAFSKRETIDFRLNEAREMESTLFDEIKNKLFKFKKVHYLFICDSNEEFVFSHVPYVSARKLERNRWDEYIGLSISDKINILAYHWKEEKIINKELIDFNALIQTKFENNNWSTILKYLAYIAVITITLNYVSSCIYSWTTKEEIKIEKQDSINKEK